MATRDFEENFFVRDDFLPSAGSLLPPFPRPDRLQASIPVTRICGLELNKWAFLSWVDFTLEYPDEVWEHDCFGQSRYFHYVTYVDRVGTVPAFAVEVTYGEDVHESYDFTLVVHEEDLQAVRSGTLLHSLEQEWARETHVRNLNEMALDKYDRSELEEARAYIDRAVELSGSCHAYLFNNRGLISWKMGETQAAKRDFLESIRLDKTNGDSYFNMGLIFFDEADYGQALHYLGRAAEINPLDTQYLTELGHVYLELGREEDALALFQKAFENNPDDAQVDFHLGYYFLYKKNEPRIAVRHLNNGLEKDPDDQFGLADLAVAHLAMGDTREALVIRSVLEKHPQPMPYTMSRLVYLNVEMGDYEAALEYYSQALELQDPFEPEWLHYHAALIYAKIGQPEEAVSVLRVAVSLGGQAVIERAKSDKGLGSLRGLPAFQRLIEASRKRTNR